MSSQSKETRIEQKAYLENKLNQRLSILADKGLEPGRIAKDTAVKKIRAKIRETATRLRVISDQEKRTAEMARIKAEKKAAPKKEKGKKQKEKAPETSKRQMKKKAKKKDKNAG